MSMVFGKVTAWPRVSMKTFSPLSPDQAGFSFSHSASHHLRAKIRRLIQR
jgi:hypothetical protein